MKYIKLFENVNNIYFWKNYYIKNVDLFNDIKVLNIYKVPYRLFYLKSGSKLYIKIYCSSYKEKIHSILKQLEFSYSSEDDINLISRWTELSKDDLDLFIDSEKYNL